MYTITRTESQEVLIETCMLSSYCCHRMLLSISGKDTKKLIILRIFNLFQIYLLNCKNAFFLALLWDWHAQACRKCLYWCFVIGQSWETTCSRAWFIKSCCCGKPLEEPKELEVHGWLLLIPWGSVFINNNSKNQKCSHLETGNGSTLINIVIINAELCIKGLIRVNN